MQIPRTSSCPEAAIPVALGQDLFWGFTTELIYKYQVRWIEMAAIMPLWTHMIVYYVEGNEGHVMNEITGELQWRTAVRGQCFSFVMPWGQMLRE